MVLCAGFYCITFIEYMIAGKTLIDYTNVFFFSNIKRMKRQYISTLKTNMTDENVSLGFKWNIDEKIYKTKNRWSKKQYFRRNKT